MGLLVEPMKSGLENNAKTVSDATSVDCANCGCPRVERFCPACGQERGSPVQPLREVVEDAAGEFLKWDSKLLITLKPLLFRPGFLTLEYLRGRRVPYISPMRLYLWVSACYFFFFAFGAQKQLEQAFVPTTPAASVPSTPERTGQATNTPVSPPVPKPASSLPATDADIRKERVKKRVEVGGKWYLENMATVAIFLLPIYAGFTALVLWRFKRVYVEHLVFTLHTQSFGFILSLVLSPLLGGMASRENAVALPVVLLIYNYIALRRIYQQNPWATFAKATLIVLLHFTASMLTGMIGILLYLFLVK